jgi:hypothetical protein
MYETVDTAEKWQAPARSDNKRQSERQKMPERRSFDVINATKWTKPGLAQLLL